jgi:DNA-binding CsgD family transcriptional regulator
MADVAGDDVSAVIQVVAAASDPTAELSMPDRKRLLAGGLAELIGADLWMWSSTAVNHETPGDFMTTCLLDGGWESEEERSKVYQTLSSELFNKGTQLPIYNAIQTGGCTTWLREEIFSPADWAPFAQIWEGVGLGGLLLAFYPISRNASSNIGFHRRRGAPEFGLREKELVHSAFCRVDWIHRHGIHEEAHEKVIRLSPRERQVLTFTLNGDGRKAIASKLGISEHTVADYQKALHKHFAVSSRAELQAYFFLGSQSELRVDKPSQSRRSTPADE